MVRRLPQECRDHRDGGDADRDVDPEHQLPVDLLDEKRTEQWTQHRGDAEHAGDKALDVCPLGRRVDVAEDRGGDRLHAAGTEALQRAEHDQHHHAARKAAQRGADQEQPCADVEHLLAPIHIGEPAIDRNADRLRQQVDGEHPGKQVESAQVGDDRRHRGGDDRALHRRHEGRHQAGGQHQGAAHRRSLRKVNGCCRGVEALVGQRSASLCPGRAARSVIPLAGGNLHDRNAAVLSAANTKQEATSDDEVPAGRIVTVDIGVDIGGTFTDIVCRRAGQTMQTLKIPTRAVIPARPC